MSDLTVAIDSLVGIGIVIGLYWFGSCLPKWFLDWKERRRKRAIKSLIWEWTGDLALAILGGEATSVYVDFMKNSGEIIENYPPDKFQDYLRLAQRGAVPESDRPTVWIVHFWDGSTWKYGLGYPKGADRYWRIKSSLVSDREVYLVDKTDGKIVLDPLMPNFTKEVLAIVSDCQTKDGMVLRDFARKVETDCKIVKPDTKSPVLANLRELSEKVASHTGNSHKYRPFLGGVENL